jgi:DNA-binding response OmpR family regulator
MAKVLFVEDDRDIVESYRTFLANKGHTVISKETAKEGYEAILSEKPDIVIIDVILEAENSGFELARKIRKNSEIKGTPIVMLTAIKEKTDLDFKQDAGKEDWLPVDAFFDKTDHPAAIMMAISNLLQKKSPDLSQGK